MHTQWTVITKAKWLTKILMPQVPHRALHKLFYKKQYHHLTQVQAILLRAVAVEGKVKQPTSGLFVKKYHLRSASSVQRALASLIEEEYLYSTEEGYIVYDRFMAIWLRNFE